MAEKLRAARGRLASGGRKRRRPIPRDEWDSNIVTDEWGEEWDVLRNGERRVPMQTSESRKTESGFLEYDTSRGHCGLCGRLDCNGGCFK